MAGESFVATDLYAPVLKAHEARLLLAIAAADIRAPDWWPEPIPDGRCLKLLKSIYGTLQTASRWHKHISVWVVANGYQ